MYSTLNNAQKQAFDGIIRRKENAWVMGPPGTGKSYLINVLKHELLEQGTVYAITAMTGAAASLLKDAVTIHKFTKTGTESLKMHLQDFPKQADKITETNREKLREVKVLFIDEAGMLSTDAAMHLDHFLRKVTGKNGKKFGGIQIVMFGDIAQLPPTATTAGAGMKRDELLEMTSIFTYPDEDIWSVYILSEFVRQADDIMLQHICLALIDPIPDMRVKAVRLLNKHCLKEQMSFVPAVRYALDTGALIVTPTKAQVETYNNVEKSILSKGAEPIHISRPEKLYNIADLSLEQISFCGGPQGVSREDREIQERNTFVDNLNLYSGQQVQIRLNGTSENGVEYYNGDICQFLEYHIDKEICVLRRRKDGKIIEVPKVEHKTEYESDIGKIGYKAFPIIPAISTNTHKVQGQTLSKIIIDPTNIKCFRANIPNMLYVMFSRAKMTGDIMLTEKIDEAWVSSPEINEYLVALWNIDFMETYPRADTGVLDSYLAEM